MSIYPSILWKNGWFPMKMWVFMAALWFFLRNIVPDLKGLDPSTFLYMEEDILFLHLMKNNLKSIYCPDITIYHKEDASTDAVLKSSHKKNGFVYRNCINSLKKLFEDFNYI